MRANLKEREYKIENTAMIVVNSSLLDFEFAAAVNDIYGLSFSRVRDLPIFGAFQCPFFTFYDEMRHLLYMLLENNRFNPIDPMLQTYDKILLINGRDSFDVQRQIYADLSASSESLTLGDATSVSAFELCRKRNFISDLCSNIIDMDYWDYSNPKQPKSSLNMKKTKIEEMSKLIQDILLYIEDYFFDEENDDDKE